MSKAYYKQIKVDKELKSQLRNQLIETMVCFDTQTTRRSKLDLIRNGFRGYEKMRDKELMREFEELYGSIILEKKGISLSEYKFFESGETLDERVARLIQSLKDQMNAVVDYFLLIK